MDWNIVLINLYNTFIGCALFALAYVANTLMGIYYNVKILEQSFDWSKIKNSVIKVLCVGIGCIMLSVVITTLPQFATLVGWTIPRDFTEIFQTLAIIGIFLYSSCKYAIEALGKLKDILNQKNFKC